MKTISEVVREKAICEDRIKQLQREVMMETDRNIAMAKLDELVIVAKRTVELDNQYKSLIAVRKIQQKIKEKKKAKREAL